MKSPRSAHLALWLLALGCAGCAGVEVTGVAGAPGIDMFGTTGGSGSGAHAPALVGRWSRTVVVTTTDGSLHESRTEWEFRADGSAARRVTTWSLDDGLYDTLLATAQWSTSGGRVTIAWLTPSVGTAIFDWRVADGLLTLGADQYARIP